MVPVNSETRLRRQQSGTPNKKKAQSVKFTGRTELLEDAIYNIETQNKSDLFIQTAELSFTALPRMTNSDVFL